MLLLHHLIFSFSAPGDWECHDSRFWVKESRLETFQITRGKKCRILWYSQIYICPILRVWYNSGKRQSLERLTRCCRRSACQRIGNYADCCIAIIPNYSALCTDSNRISPHCDSPRSQAALLVCGRPWYGDENALTGRGHRQRNGRAIRV